MFNKNRYFRKQLVKGLIYNEDPNGNSSLRVATMSFVKDKLDRTRSGKSEFLLPGTNNTLMGDEPGTGGILVKTPFPFCMFPSIPKEIPDVLGLAAMVPAIVIGVVILKENY